MKGIKDQEFGGERPLYKLHDARLERVTIHLGESSIKNPTSGSITVAGHIGELIIDENQKAPADCTIHEIHAE